MKNLTVVLFVIAVLLALTGCGTVNANNPPCDLSTLKIKSVVLEGDTTGMVTAALERELFAHGAKVTYEGGVKIVGKVTMSGTSPHYLVARAENQPFSGIAYSNFSMPTAASDQLGRVVARDFCQCMAGGASVHSLSLTKKE